MLTEEATAPITPADVSRWMVAQIKTYGSLEQTCAAAAIQAQFGDEFVYRDPNEYLAIKHKVLYQFRKMTVDSVVWEIRDGNWLDGRWRKCKFSDTPWRRQNTTGTIP